MASDDRSVRRGSTSAYLFSLVATAAAVALRAILDPWLGNHVAFVSLPAAVAASVWLGGYRPAVVAAALGFLACDYLFVEPRGALGPVDAADLAGLVAYVVSCSIIIAFGEAMRVAQRRARDDRELLWVTFASIGDAVITTDTDGRVTSLNAAAGTLTGWAEREVRGRPLDRVFRIVDEETREPVESPAARALREETVVGLANHTVLVRKDGSECPIDDSAAPIRDGDGRVTGCVLVFRDVTERRRAAQALQRSERELSDFFENASVGLHWVGPDGTILRVNQAELDMLGYERAEYVGRHIADFHVDRPVIDEILRLLTAGETLHDYPARLRCKDGSMRDVLISSNVLFEDGTFVHTRCFTRDVTEQKRAERALREADRRKDEFLATLAHELRNPLAPIYNSLEIIKHADADPALRRRARDTVERQLAHMVRLVDDLLDVSRITRDRLELRKVRVDLASIIHQAVETCRPLTEHEHQVVEVALPAEPVVLEADPVRLAQVFGNLINNGCKYTGRGGTIRVEAAADAGQVVVSIKDSGIGIPPDQLESIFEMFAQVDQALERSRGGLGIGLTLVKRLVEMHGGGIEARSEGLGHGSEFVVRLPVARDVPARDVAAATTRDGGEPRRILVVDDNRDSAESLSTLLQLSGHETRTAYDGLEAVEAAERFRPDVVLLDIGLPGLNGIDACRRIREQPWGADVVIVALTGWGQDEDRRRSREAGFDGHVVKPIDHAALMEMLGSLLSDPGGRHRERERTGGHPARRDA